MKKLRDGTYTSLDGLTEDVETACADLIASVKTDEPAINGSVNRYIPPSVETTRLVTGVLAFQKVLKAVILREVHRKSLTTVSDVRADQEEEDVKPFVNGKKEFKAIKADQADGKTVLTLFANASGPRMLFSSLQQAVRVPSTSSTTLDTSVAVTLPIQESTLPNILSATKIVATDLDETKKEKKKPSTFGELFAPPASIPQLSPPKPAKSLTTRGSSITWVPAPTESSSKSTRSGFVYSKQPLTTGQWLGYSGVDSPQEPVTAEAKQKHRQRALSTGEPNPPLSKATVAALNQAKEDALFRSAYSSFAPTYDDAIAIVPAKTRNQVWWRRIGSNKFTEAFAIDPALLGEEPDTEPAEPPEVDEEAEVKAFEEAVEDFDPEMLPPGFPEPSGDKATDDILKEISELLETLHSYQRIRNSSLATSARTPVVQNSSLAQLNGTPSNPSSAEVETYDILKTQLALMIQMLPPYAVAKLNGDQLSELNISRNIVIETKDYRGVMEEDPITRQSKTNAMNPTPGPQLARAAGSHQQYGTPTTQYARQAAPVSVRAANYYPQQAAVRSPSIQYNQGRTPSYSTPAGYAASRPGYGPQPGYNQQTPSRHHSYSQQTPAASQYYQRPSTGAQNYGMPSTYYPQTPQTAPSNRGIPPPGAGAAHPSSYTQQRPAAAQAPSANYNYAAYNNHAQSPHMRNASPLKPGQGIPAQPGTPTHPHHAQYQQPPPPGGYQTPLIGQPPALRTASQGSNSASHVSGFNFAGRPPSAPGGQHQHPQQQGQSQASYASHPSAYQQQSQVSNSQAHAVGPSGFHTSMTPAEQTAMLDRQRAALNLTPGGTAVPARTVTPGTPSTAAQQIAAAARQGSGTPVPVSHAGQGGQVNGGA